MLIFFLKLLYSCENEKKNMTRTFCYYDLIKKNAQQKKWTIKLNKFVLVLGAVNKILNKPAADKSTSIKT